MLNLSSIDFLAGIASGVAGSFIAHPLDTIKVRVQSGQAGTSKIFPTAYHILKHEGVSLRESMRKVLHHVALKKLISPCAIGLRILQGPVVSAGGSHAHQRGHVDHSGVLSEGTRCINLLWT